MGRKCRCDNGLWTHYYIDGYRRTRVSSPLMFAFSNTVLFSLNAASAGAGMG